MFILFLCFVACENANVQVPNITQILKQKSDFTNSIWYKRFKVWNSIIPCIAVFCGYKSEQFLFIFLTLKTLPITLFDIYKVINKTTKWPKWKMANIGVDIIGAITVSAFYFNNTQILNLDNASSILFLILIYNFIKNSIHTVKLYKNERKFWIFSGLMAFINLISILESIFINIKKDSSIEKFFILILFCSLLSIFILRVTKYFFSKKNLKNRQVQINLV